MAWPAAVSRPATEPAWTVALSGLAIMPPSTMIAAPAASIAATGGVSAWCARPASIWCRVTALAASTSPMPAAPVPE